MPPLKNEDEPMNTPRSKRNGRDSIPGGGVMAADAGQWRHWLTLSPAERLDAASRLWLQTCEFNKQTKRDLGLALRARAARV
jgi:hypothetical protein